MLLREQLIHNYTKQANFASTYSPLYTQLFSQVAGWLEDEEHPVTVWLVEVGKTRNPFDMTLLLMAGLHEAILAELPSAENLRRFYPTVGGMTDPGDPSFAATLQSTILALQDHLTLVIQTANVQTNETGRGSSWLLPLAFCTWTEVELLDMGASAGLNLLADQRQFELLNGDQALMLLGNGTQPEMMIKAAGNLDPFWRTHNNIPKITARRGIDLMPFELKSAADDLRLKSYIWGDQPDRMDRLDRALAIYKTAQRSKAPIQLEPVSLPDQLEAYLHSLPQANTPLVVYNTIVTMYFPDDRPQLEQTMTVWASQQSRPVLWVQWEPPTGWMEENRETGEFGWAAWTADLWQAGEHHQFMLGWVHPHGLAARFTGGLQKWAAFWR